MTTPNMGLTFPTRGPAGTGLWGDTLDADSTIIDGHDHTPGKGVKVPVAGLNVNDDISFSGLYGASSLSRAQFSAIAASGLTGKDMSLFVSDGTSGLAANELYWRNSSGANVRITAGGSLYANVYDVTAYGGIGSGSSNDTQAIRDAITAAVADRGIAYGAIVFLPKGTWGIDSRIDIPNGVGLRGDGPTSTVISAIAGFSDTSMIANSNQTGTQEFCFLENLSVYANKTIATCTEAAVSFGSLFINSYIHNVVITNSSSIGLRIFAADAMGPVEVTNTWVLHSNSHNIMVEELVTNTHACAGIYFANVTSEHQGQNSSAIYLKGTGHSGGYNLRQIHIEQGSTETGRTGITLDGVSMVSIDGVQLQAGNAANITAGITITNVITNVNIQIRSVTNINLITPVLQDLKNGITVAAPTYNLPWYATPDVQFRGGARFTPATGAVSAAFQNAAGTDKVWFDDAGRMTGSSFSGAALDLKADATNDRAIAFANNALTRHVGFHFPDASSFALTSYTSGLRFMQWDNSSNATLYQNLTVNALGGFTSFTNSMRFPREIAPAALTANTDNYAPTLINDATVLLISSTGAVDLTGIAAPPTPNGKPLWVYNNGSNTITLKHLVTSSAANQFVGIGNADTLLAAGKGVLLYYSATRTKWIILGATP